MPDGQAKKSRESKFGIRCKVKGKTKIGKQEPRHPHPRMATINKEYTMQVASKNGKTELWVGVIASHLPLFMVQRPQFNCSKV